MSKFWGGSDSSDNEDEVSEDKDMLSGSDNEDGSSDEGGEGEEGEKAIDWGIDSDSEGEEDKRVVKSVRDKRYEEMHKLIESLEKDMKEADWVNINTGTLSLPILPHGSLPPCRL
jgi:translation initiation factor 3 subunit C